jgi:multiple sugar transport system permease protein
MYMSFFQWDFLNPAQSEFVGLDNYATVLADSRFHAALFQTFYFVLLTVIQLTVLGLVMALGVNRGIKGTRFLQFTYFVPYVMTISIVGLVWIQMYGANGVITHYTEPILGRVLGEPGLAMIAIAVTTVWWQVGFFFAILLAARQGVSDSLYEAAKLDGASRYAQFRHITLPLVKPIGVFLLLVSLIGSLKLFAYVWAMTQGGPAFNSEVLVTYMFKLGFKQTNMGKAAAVGVILFALIFVVTVVATRIVGIDADYQAAG